MTTLQPIVVFTAPSGAGKTSIVRHLLARFPQLSFSISASTRGKRMKEVDGKDYYFIPLDVFHQKIRDNEFAEWEMVYEGKYYGTLRSELDRIWAMDKVPVLDIDVKGAIHVQQQYPHHTLTVFIEPPSVDELRRRLQGRGTESTDSLETRVNKAEYELSFRNHFNAAIVNKDLAQACREADALVSAFLERLGAGQ